MPKHERRGELVTSKRGFFWVGVERKQTEAGTVAYGPMFVQWEEPENVTKSFPIVLVHGGGGQATDWLGTPDGRPGWATYLLQEGYAVYVVDRPGHGRSPYHPDVLGPMGAPFTYELSMALFTAMSKGPLNHPAAHLHSQWLGSGEIGDETLDQFSASSGPMMANFPAAHALEQSRIAALLDEIGPAVVVTHSAGGPTGWLAADARPQLVKALVAIEPLGPPFLENPMLGVSLDWGLTAAPLTYDPPVANASELARERHEFPQPGPPPKTLQAEPARKLANLQGIPIAVVSSEASAFSFTDPYVAEFLQQAGCDAEHMQLADHGVHGNGHLMMLERNSREALQPILDWLDAKVD